MRLSWAHASGCSAAVKLAVRSRTVLETRAALRNLRSTVPRWSFLIDGPNRSRRRSGCRPVSASGPSAYAKGTFPPVNSSLITRTKSLRTSGLLCAKPASAVRTSTTKCASPRISTSRIAAQARAALPPGFTSSSAANRACSSVLISDPTVRSGCCGDKVRYPGAAHRAVPPTFPARAAAASGVPPPSAR